MFRFSTPSTSSTRNRLKFKRVKWADEENTAKRRTNSTETGNPYKLSQIVFKLTSKFDGMHPENIIHQSIENTHMVTERNSYNDNDISIFHKVTEGVDDVNFSSEAISLINQRDKILKTTKHVDNNFTKDIKKTIGVSYFQNKQQDDKFKLNIERMKQQFDRTKIRTSEPSYRNYQNCYFDQGKNQKQSVSEFFNLHKTPSQSDLMNIKNCNKDNKHELKCTTLNKKEDEDSQQEKQKLNPMKKTE